ncbi:MAG: PHB depolymerase family esterase [Beijerinckiaceae bacterium]
MTPFASLGTRWIAAIVAVAALSVSSARAADCGANASCPVPNGSYLVRTPAGWDGKSSLPVLFFFHGHRGSAKQTMDNKGYAKVADDFGALLVALDGKNGTWSFPAKISHDRDDFKYVADVRHDVMRRFPVDTGSMLVSGHSVGGSMAWYVACLMGKEFSAYAPVAGAYWRPHPVECTSGPVNMRHVHGLNDRTVPMAGRVLRNGTLRQGDVRESFRSLVARDGCPASPASSSRPGRLTCETWTAKSCASGREAVLCLHQGGHEIEAGWLADAFAWMKSLPTRQASR